MDGNKFPGTLVWWLLCALLAEPRRIRDWHHTHTHTVHTPYILICPFLGCGEEFDFPAAAYQFLPPPPPH